MKSEKVKTFLFNWKKIYKIRLKTCWVNDKSILNVTVILKCAFEKIFVLILNMLTWMYPSRRPSTCWQTCARCRRAAGPPSTRCCQCTSVSGPPAAAGEAVRQRKNAFSSPPTENISGFNVLVIIPNVCRHT